MNIQHCDEWEIKNHTQHGDIFKEMGAVDLHYFKSNH